MQPIQYKPIEEVDFELEISTDLFQKIIQEGDNKAYRLLNPDDDIIFVYNKILKWIFKESPFDITRLKLAYEIGYEDGFSDIQKKYADKYVIGSDQIQKNLKEIYRRLKLFRDINHNKLNPVLIMAYGESAGATRRIEELALIYPADFEWLYNDSYNSTNTNKPKENIKENIKINKNFKLREFTGITYPPIKITYELVEKYYYWLKDNNSINCELDDFTNIFSNNKLREDWEPIIWLRNGERGKTKGKPNAVALAAIIVELLDIPQSEIYAIKLGHFFVNKNGDQIKPDIRQNKKNLSTYLPILI